MAIIRVSSDEHRTCPKCNAVKLAGDGRFEEACNHLLETHQMKRVHIGQETTLDLNGNPIPRTVAIFED